MQTDAAHLHPPQSTEAFLLSLPRPIAVVGSARPARDFGALIDSYPSVLRFNNFETRGFELQVGQRTTVRVCSGWITAKPQSALPEISPFHRGRMESSRLDDYERRGGRLLTAAIDVMVNHPAVTRPSTGLALLLLCNHLGIEVDAFGFDSFASGHYWEDGGKAFQTPHGRSELSHILALPKVTLMAPTFDYRAAHQSWESSRHSPLDHGLQLLETLGIGLRGERILAFGCAHDELAQQLKRQGNDAMALELTAGRNQSMAATPTGETLDLTLLARAQVGAFDRFISFGTLEHLNANDLRITLRAAGLACRGLLISVSTLPGSAAQVEAGLYQSAHPVQWWLDTLREHFVVNTVAAGTEIGQMLFEGYSRQHAPADMTAIEPDLRLPCPPHDAALELPPGYVSRPRPEYWVDSIENNKHVTWQPDVYPAAAMLAERLGCSTIIDIGCGEARKLLALPRSLRLIGVDYGSNMAFCRERYRRGYWLEADFETPIPLPIPRDVLADSVIVCADVIEHMADPMMLLALLKHLMRHAAALVLSTPDRLRTRGAAHNGPPPNSAHTREWTVEELGRLLSKAGFAVADLSHTRSNDQHPRKATSMAILVNPEHPAVTALCGEVVAPVPAEVPLAEPAQPVSASAGSAASSAEAISHDIVEELIAQARQCLADNNVDGFESALRQALLHAPGHAGALRFLASLQLNLGDPATAAQIYDDLITNGHRDAEVLEGVVLAHWRSGNVKSAAQRMLTYA